MISYAVFCLKKKKQIKKKIYCKLFVIFFFFLMIRRPPRSTQSRSSAASDVYKRQTEGSQLTYTMTITNDGASAASGVSVLSLIHISEPTRLGMISYAVFCLKQK